MKSQISVSELNSFLRCRRAWDLTSTSRQSLRHKVTPRLFFTVGNAVHEAIDAQARGDDCIEAFEAYVEKERHERTQAYIEAHGTQPWENEFTSFNESVELSRSLVHQYFDHYGWENPLQELGLEYVATEVPFRVPLSDDVDLVGTFDGIAVDIETRENFYLVENKTRAGKPKVDQIRRENQFIGYNWAFMQLTDKAPAGTIYNCILKNVISSPRVLKSGGLSTDKTARVTLRSFTEALLDGGHDPVKYLDYLNFLEERERQGDERFFIRSQFNYTPLQLHTWFASALAPAVQDIFDPNLRVYPNYTQCDNCLVSDLCVAYDNGDQEEYDLLVETKYKVGSYGTMNAVDGATPVVVASSEDLIRHLREGR